MKMTSFVLQANHEIKVLWWVLTFGKSRNISVTGISGITGLNGDRERLKQYCDNIFLDLFFHARSAWYLFRRVRPYVRTYVRT